MEVEQQATLQQQFISTCSLSLVYHLGSDITDPGPEPDKKEGAGLCRAGGQTTMDTTDPATPDLVRSQAKSPAWLGERLLVDPSTQAQRQTGERDSHWGLRFRHGEDTVILFSFFLKTSSLYWFESCPHMDSMP